MKSKIKGDKRFNLRGLLSKEQLIYKLQEYDLAVIPSIWLETGPLTVMEALSAGLPIAGSNIGGIKELIKGIPGCKLLEPNLNDWEEYIRSLIDNPNQIDVNLPRPRTFDDLANELTRAFKNKFECY